MAVSNEIKQLEQLRIKFNNMNIQQKRQFINSLKTEVQKTNSSEKINFFNECIQKYNSEFHNSSQTAIQMNFVPIQTNNSKCIVRFSFVK